MNIEEYQGYHELAQHTSQDFPYNTYPCAIPQDFSSVPLHWHDTAEIIVIKKGYGIVSLDMEDLVCREGDFVLVLPGHLHAILPCAEADMPDGKDHAADRAAKECAEGPGPAAAWKAGRRGERPARMEYENIIFSTSLLLARQRDLTSTLIESFLKGDYPPENLLFSGKQRWHDNARLIIEETDLLCNYKPDGYQIAVRGNLLRLFYLIISRTQKQAGPVQGQSSKIHAPERHAGSARQKNTQPRRTDTVHLEKIKLIVKYVEAHFADPITIEDMAALSGYSASHFMKFFRQVMGCSFISWLDRYRLAMAARMLKVTTDSILTVSSSAGYSNLSYFNRSFKARYGMTPGQYRRM